MRVTAPAPSSISSNWTRASIVRLLHSIILSNLTPKYIYTLLPSHTNLDINTLLKSLTSLSNNRLSEIPSICAGVELYPRRRMVLKKSKLLTKFPKTRVSVLVTPADNTSLAAVSEAGHHPFVEVVLKQNRPCWHVVTHLYSKWSLPFQLVDNNDQSFQVSTSVGCLPTQTNTTSSSQHSNPVVTVHYRIVKPHIKWSLIATALRPHPPTLPQSSPSNNIILNPNLQSSTQTTSTPHATSSSNAEPPVIRKLRARILQPDQLPLQADSNPVYISTNDVISEQDSTPQKRRHPPPPQPVIHTVCPDQFLATASLFDMPVNVALPDSLLSTSGDREITTQHGKNQPYTNNNISSPNQCVPPEAPSLPPDFLQTQKPVDVEVDVISFENHVQEDVQPNERQLLQEVHEQHEQHEHEIEQNGVLTDTHQIQMQSEDACASVEHDHDQVQPVFDHDEHNLFHTFSLGLHSRSVFGADHGFSQPEQVQSNSKEVPPLQNSLGFSGLFTSLDQ